MKNRPFGAALSRASRVRALVRPIFPPIFSPMIPALVSAVVVAGCASSASAQDAPESVAGLPFHQIWRGLAQTPHQSPIAPLTAFAGPGLSDPARPGLAPRPVLSFFPTLRQHRDSGPSPAAPLFAFDRAQIFMPHRNDHVRTPAGAFDTLRRSAARFKATGGYASPGDAYESFAQWTHRGAKGYLRGFANAAAAGVGDYKTGGGRTTPYEFQLNTQQLVAGYTPSPDVEVFGVLLRSDIDGFATPSSGLDDIATDRLMGRAGVELRQGGLGFERLRAEASIRGAERVNNNFDLRAFTPGPGARRQQVENERRFIDIELLGDATIGAIETRYAISGGQELRDGLRFSDADPLSADPDLDIVSAVTFPDIEVFDLGARWEAAASLTDATHLKLGAQYRSVWAGARAADRTPDGPFGVIAPGLAASASNLYDVYYGEAQTERRFDLLGARAHLQQGLADRVALFGELGRLERAPDSKELFFAAAAPPPQAQNRIIGNPGLAKERHLRAGFGAVAKGPDWIAFARSRRAGAGLQTGAWRAMAGVSFSRVDDFISRDRARGQSGVLAADGATVFRNIDAVFWRAEADLAWNLTPQLSTRANLVYSFGDNRDDDRPLYGIAPLEGTLIVDWTDSLGDLGAYSLGSKLRLVAAQTRFDDDPAAGSGFDDGGADGFAVLDVYGSALIADRFALQLGAENLLDADYAEHAPAAPLEAARRLKVGAPGRAFYLRAAVAF